MCEIEIVPNWPSAVGKSERAWQLNRLIGSTVLEIGTAKNCPTEGGGLAVRYLTANGMVETVLFGFNELGLWLEDGPDKNPTSK